MPVIPLGKGPNPARDAMTIWCRKNIAPQSFVKSTDQGINFGGLGWEIRGHIIVRQDYEIVFEWEIEIEDEQQALLFTLVNS